MNKLEQAARQAFETWWEREGQEFLYALNTTTDDDIKLVAEIAWKNGAYCAEQAEQEPVAWWFQPPNKNVRPMFDTQQHGGKWQPLYAAPVRTKDLTDDEIAEAVGSPLDEVYLADFRAVIAADREKNK